jgi:hypothetical protein
VDSAGARESAARVRSLQTSEHVHQTH